jgi:apolipoprotein N-acyltransferase
LPLVRVANTGISAFVSPYGEIISKIPLNNESEKTFKLITPLERTIYRTYGEYIFLLSILILVFINKLYNCYYKENSYEK